MGHPDQVLRILSVIESERDHSEILRDLQALGRPIYCQRVYQIQDLERELDHSSWSMVLCLSGTLNYQEALREVKRVRPELPFVLISNGIGEEEVVQIMKAGAEDVVTRSKRHRLLQVVARIIREKEMKEKEASSQKIAQEAYAAREQMLAIVSHDIKNPLSAIQLEAQILLKTSERHANNALAGEVKIQATRILKTTHRLKSLIIDLLEKNKTEDGLSTLNKTNCEITKLFHEVLDSNRPLLRQKRIGVQTSVSGNVTISLDKNKMFQVLNNLLSNAIKFTPMGGTIEFAMAEHSDHLDFSISDTGPGLPADDLLRVFDKYWTGGVEGCSGTGLGLYICKSIIEAHGGHIRAENLDIGSKFSFTLPKSTSSMSSNFPHKDSRGKILIVDDDEDLREVMCWALGKEGFSVQSYGNPSEALENLRLGRHFPHLIVVDNQMDGMCGTEFLKHKRLIEDPAIKDCPVLMISASPEEVKSPDLYQEILSKPIDLEALVGNIRKYVS